MGRRVSDGDEVLGPNGGRVPTTAAVQPTVEPPQGTVGVISRGLVSTAAIEDGAMWMSACGPATSEANLNHNTHGPSAWSIPELAGGA
jgi:hypothetical protein